MSFSWILYVSSLAVASAADTVAPPFEKEGDTFGPYAAKATGSWPGAVAMGDVTGDGRTDIVLATGTYFDKDNDDHVFVFPGLAGGGIGSATKYPYDARTNYVGLALCDFDGDGVLDVIVGHAEGVSILLADGAGGLHPADVVDDERTASVRTMDVDLDGAPDIITLSDPARILYNDGKGGVSESEVLGNWGSDQEIADLNSDGFPDVAITDGAGFNPLTVHLHDGVSGFLAPDSYSFNHGATPGGVGVGDVDGDGRNDVVLSRVANEPAAGIDIYLQNDSGTLSAPVTIDGDDVPEPVEIADLDLDGLQDVVTLHGGYARLGVYLQGPKGLEPEVEYEIPAISDYRPQSLAIGDWSGDGCPDVAIADYSNGLVTLEGLCLADTDLDGVNDRRDNCVDVNNTNQLDADEDGVGDLCDNCISVSNASQADADSDSLGDACDICDDVPDIDQQADGDADGAGDACDVCPVAWDPDQLNSDHDAHGDECDNCPTEANDDQVDADDDGYGDACDNCPTRDNTGQQDADGDGYGDICDCAPLDPAFATESQEQCGNDTELPESDTLDVDESGCGCSVGRRVVAYGWLVPLLLLVRRRRVPAS